MPEVNIKEASGIKYNGNSLFVSFKYNEELVKKMRQLSKKWYHPQTKTYEVPMSCKQELKDLFSNKSEEKIKNSFKPSDKKEVINSVDIPNLNLKTELHSYQIEAVKYGIAKSAWFCADEMGTGKTITSLAYALSIRELRQAKHCLIICGINGLKYNWLNEVQKHTYEKALILGSRINKNGKLVVDSKKDIINHIKNIPNDTFFLITNIETIRDEKVVAAIQKQINNGEISILVVDEAQAIKNVSSLQTKHMLKLKTTYRLALTGTPVMNNPLELYPILNWLGIENHNFYQFRNFYAVLGGYKNYEVVGYKNLDDLQYKLDKIMIRRLKKDLIELPEKNYIMELLEMSNAQKKIYNEVKDSILQDIDKIKLNPNPLASLIRLRQATADTSILSSTVSQSCKFDRLLSLSEELKNNNQSFVVVSNWSTVANKARELLKSFNPAFVTGEVKNKMDEVNRFMNDDNCKCIIGTTGALGTGYNLTKATTIIFLDSPWNKATKVQAEDRIHRIGTKSSVNIITLVCKDTIDEKIEDLIYNKGEMADFLVDYKDNIKNRNELLDYLLN